MNNLELAQRGLKQLKHAKGKAERDKYVKAAWEKAFDALPLAEQTVVTAAAQRLAMEVPNLGELGATEILVFVGGLMDERDYRG